MGKWVKIKPRHNPDKPQNNYGGDGDCPYFDGYIPGSKKVICEAGVRGAKCNGNRHNCVKQKYRLMASVKPEKVQYLK